MAEAAPAAPAPAASPAPAPAPATPAASAPKAGKTPPPLPTPAKDAEPEKVRVRAHDRARNVKAKLEESEGPAETGEAPEPKERAEARPDKPEPEKAAPDEAAEKAKTAREERAKRLEAVRAKERAAEAEREKRREHRGSEQEVEKLRKRIAELEPLNDIVKSEERLLEWAEQQGMSSEKLVSYMRQKLTDPASVARNQAKTEADKVRDEFAQMRKEYDAKLQQLEAERQAIRDRHEAHERARQFEQMVASSGETHPLSARLLKRHGINTVTAFANEQLMPYLTEGYELGHLLDTMEEYLEFLHGGESPGPDAAANGTSQPPKKSGADKPITTLSNALASGRTTVTEDIHLAHMPLEERRARLKAKLGDG